MVPQVNDQWALTSVHLFTSDLGPSLSSIHDIPLNEDELSMIKYAVFDSDLPSGWCQLCFQGCSRIFRDDGAVCLIITIRSDGVATQRAITGIRRLHDILSCEYPRNTSINEIFEWAYCDLMNSRLCWFRGNPEVELGPNYSFAFG